MWKRSIGFEIKELLGEGGQGRVYRAQRRDPQTGLSQTVAVKILHSETTVDAWKAEFDSLAKVRSPHCVQVFGFERLNGRPALVLEFVDGVSLSALGRACWLNEDDVVEILAQCEAAVLDLYKFGVFHGDLSPHNIMIDRDGHLRLLDFGLANCKAGIARATVEFAAPERLCGEPVSLPSDIFSLGRIEQFLRGRVPAPDPGSPYLRAEPARRSLRGLFSKKERRQALGEKVLAFRHRQELSRFAKTRTQILKKTMRPASVFLAAITLCFLLTLSGAEKSAAAARASVLRIHTHHWFYFHLNGKPIGYSPIDITLDAGRSYKLEWRGENGGGTRELRLPAGRIYRYTDRDFSH